jgi:hypothetical protein
VLLVVPLAELQPIRSYSLSTFAPRYVLANPTQSPFAGIDCSRAGDRLCAVTERQSKSLIVWEILPDDTNQVCLYFSRVIRRFD